MDWHNLSIEEVLSSLKSSLHGLDLKEVRVRLAQYGHNRIAVRKGPSIFTLFFRQFFNLLVFILLVGVAVEYLARDFLDGTVLAGTILIMAFIGFFQELRAERAMKELKKLYAPKSKVKRGGKIIFIPSDHLVPGDVIHLESGDKIPADARLLDVANFKVNESTLTGEAFPAQKVSRPLAKTLPLAERKNMVYTGTTVTSGKATAICVSTGMNTELGKIAEAIQEVKSPKTPLQKSIHSLGLWMTGCVFVVVAIFIAISFYQGFGWFEVIMLSVSATIAGVPEGLPAAVTIVLATGMHAMVKRNAIIRQLSAVETLGSTSLICSDKTGTLTMNQMTVSKMYVFRKNDFRQMLIIGALCNDAYITKEKERYEIVGDPTEGALLLAAAKEGLDHNGLKIAFPRLGEIPFESENLYMATLHSTLEGKKIFIKGSPEKLLEFSTLTEREKEEVLEETKKMSHEALRLIAIGYVQSDLLSEESIQGRLSFVGVFGMIDPPREEAIQAVDACHKAGIKVVMVTGDNKLTAAAIARELNITHDGVITSQEIETMTDDELREAAKTITVFARIEPLHKLRIVQAFKSLGHVVAMTGDGVNDAPALEAADIGVAMGISGTDVAKEASDMILQDDNFATVVAAVEEGRAIFSRLRNVCTFLLITSFGELFGLTLCVLFTGFAPLTPLQILWINMFTGVIVTLPLAAEPKTGDELNQLPRDPDVKLIYLGIVFRIVFLALMLGISAYLIFDFSLVYISLDKARTMTFCAIVVFEWLTAFNIRSDEKTIFQLGWLTNKSLIVAVTTGLLFHLLIVYLPVLQSSFKTTPLELHEWGIVLLPGIIIFAAETLRKLFAPKLFSRGKWRKEKKNV